MGDDSAKRGSDGEILINFPSSATDSVPMQADVYLTYFRVSDAY